MAEIYYILLYYLYAVSLFNYQRNNKTDHPHTMAYPIAYTMAYTIGWAMGYPTFCTYPHKASILQEGKCLKIPK